MFSMKESKQMVRHNIKQKSIYVTIYLNSYNFFWDKVLGNPGCPGASNDLEVLLFLFLPPKGYAYRYVPPCPIYAVLVTKPRALGMLDKLKTTHGATSQVQQLQLWNEYRPDAFGLPIQKLLFPLQECLKRY